MITEDLQRLADFLLDKTQLFHQGFANVYLDELTGLIYQGDSFEKFAVGINDQFGNYFYIRTEATIDYADSRPALSDTSKSLDETVRCFLVAVVDRAKPKELIQVLLNTILHYGEKRIRPIRSVHHRETAVAKELAKLVDKETIQYVLQNLRELQVVILEFAFTTTFQQAPVGCLPSPCKSEC